MAGLVRARGGRPGAGASAPRARAVALRYGSLPAPRWRSALQAPNGHRRDGGGGSGAAPAWLRPRLPPSGGRIAGTPAGGHSPRRRSGRRRGPRATPRPGCALRRRRSRSGAADRAAPEAGVAQIRARPRPAIRADRFVGRAGGESVRRHWKRPRPPPCLDGDERHHLMVATAEGQRQGAYITMVLRQPARAGSSAHTTYRVQYRRSPVVPKRSAALRSWCFSMPGIINRRQERIRRPPGAPCGPNRSGRRGSAAGTCQPPAGGPACLRQAARRCAPARRRCAP